MAPDLCPYCKCWDDLLCVTTYDFDSMELGCVTFSTSSKLSQVYFIPTAEMLLFFSLVFAIIDRSSWQKIFPANKSVVSLVISCWVWTSCVTFSYITCQQTCTDFVSSLSLDHVSCLSLSLALMPVCHLRGSFWTPSILVLTISAAQSQQSPSYPLSLFSLLQFSDTLFLLPFLF